MSARPRIWVLLGHRRGDNNQLLALAEGLGLPFETRTIGYRKTARAWMKHRDGGRTRLAERAFRQRLRRIAAEAGGELLDAGEDEGTADEKTGGEGE